MTPIKVYVVDDSAVVRQTMAHLLSGIADIELPHGCKLVGVELPAGKALAKKAPAKAKPARRFCPHKRLRVAEAPRLHHVQSDLQTWRAGPFLANIIQPLNPNICHFKQDS